MWDDQPLSAITGTVARSLLAYLVTYRDQAHTRNLLAGTFWPDLPNATARRRLSQALWRIRRTLECPPLPAPLLLTPGDTLQLNPDLPLALDVAQFEAHVARTRQAGETPAAGSLRRAVECYRGDFLAGYYDDWALVERERLREGFLGALERLVDALKAAGDYPAALSYARRLATEDPLREEAHHEVMRLCHLLGRDNQALSQFQTCCQVMADELNAEPSAGTLALADEIAARAGVAEMPHLPVAPRPAPPALLERPEQAPLVGRRAERATLARDLEQAASGSGGMVLLAGAAGVGKTRLMQKVARDAAWRGLRVVWGHSCELSPPPPYQPLVEALHDADLASLPEVWQQELGRLMPGLPAPPPVTLQPEQERGRLLEALARAFLALAQSRPHLVILEDVHWMDPASLAALRVLLPRLPTSRLLVVCTLRPEELAEQPGARRSLAALQATRLPRPMTLAPLSEAETGDLIQRVLGLAQPAPLFSRRLYAQTGGNPFFVRETLWTLVDEGLLYRDEGGGWCTPWDDATRDYAELPVPPGVAQSLARRLARLSPPAHELLGLAAVIGRRVAFDAWIAAGKGDESGTLAAAEELVRRGLLLETGAEADDAPGYCFAHDIVRQVVYDGLSPVRRQRWHRRVAAALEALHPGHVEALARHFWRAQDWSPAVHYAQKAGERAQAVYANRQALDHYRHADAWLAEGRVDWPGDAVARRRAELAEKQGQVYSLVGEYPAAQAALTRAWQALAALDDRRGVVRVLNQLSFLGFIQNDYATASRHAEMALAALPQKDPPPDLHATTLTHLGLSAWGQGRYDAAQAPLEQALALFEALGSDPYDMARCLNSLGLVHLARGELPPAERYFARSLAVRQEIHDRRGEAWCWHNLGRTALVRGDLAAARAKLETAQATFAAIEHPYGLDTCARFLAQVAQAEAASSALRQIKVRLPRANGAPRDAEHIDVTWTVAAPQDADVGDKVARRRAQILRLLAEAEAQGAAPTPAHLAQALGVSRRTIQRDMAALRRQSQGARHLFSGAGHL